MNTIKRSLIVILMLFSLSISLATVQVTAQDGKEIIEPEAGSRNTWLLESSSELELEAPQDEVATMAEIEEL